MKKKTKNFNNKNYVNNNKKNKAKKFKPNPNKFNSNKFKSNNPEGKNNKKQLYQSKQKSNGQNCSINQSKQFIVYIGNLFTDQLKNNDINNLIKSFLANQTKNTNSNNNKKEINSIKVYKDCLYIFFENEQEALDASKYFNNYTFKSNKLESYFLNSDKINLNSSNEEFNLGDDNDNNDNDDNDDDDFENDSYSKENIDFDYKKFYKFNSIECEILVSNRQLKKYADSVNDKLNKDLFGINTCVKYTNSDSNEEEQINKTLLQDGFNRNLLYLIYINQSNEQFNSINLIIFNKWRLKKNDYRSSHTIKENKNMPLNKAYEMLKSDYHDYIADLKEIYQKQNESKLDSSYSSQDENDDDNDSESDKIEDSEDRTNMSISNKDKELFNLVFKKFNDTEQININDLDFMLTFINKQKSNLLSKLKPLDKSEYKAESSLTNQFTQQISTQNINNQFLQSFQSSQQSQASFQQLIQQPIPSLLPQLSSFYASSTNVIQPQLNFIPSIGNLNQPPSLMSLINQPNQAPSLMSLQTNFNNSSNTANSNSKNNNFKRY